MVDIFWYKISLSLSSWAVSFRLSRASFISAVSAKNSREQPRPAIREDVMVLCYVVESKQWLFVWSLTIRIPWTLYSGPSSCSMAPLVTMLFCFTGRSRTVFWHHLFDGEKFGWNHENNARSWENWSNRLFRGNICFCTANVKFRLTTSRDDFC